MIRNMIWELVSVNLDNSKMKAANVLIVIQIVLNVLEVQLNVLPVKLMKA